LLTTSFCCSTHSDMLVSRCFSTFCLSPLFVLVSHNVVVESTRTKHSGSLEIEKQAAIQCRLNGNQGLRVEYGAEAGETGGTIDFVGVPSWNGHTHATKAYNNEKGDVCLVAYSTVCAGGNVILKLADSCGERTISRGITSNRDTELRKGFSFLHMGKRNETSLMVSPNSNAPTTMTNEGAWVKFTLISFVEQVPPVLDVFVDKGIAAQITYNLGGTRRLAALTRRLAPRSALQAELEPQLDTIVKLVAEEGLCKIVKPLMEPDSKFLTEQQYIAALKVHHMVLVAAQKLRRTVDATDARDFNEKATVLISMYNAAKSDAPAPVKWSTSPSEQVHASVKVGYGVAVWEDIATTRKAIERIKQLAEEPRIDGSTLSRERQLELNARIRVDAENIIKMMYNTFLSKYVLPAANEDSPYKNDQDYIASLIAHHAVMVEAQNLKNIVRPKSIADTWESAQSLSSKLEHIFMMYVPF